MTGKNPERRRWFQFRLRTLLVAVLVLSLALSWFGVGMQRVRSRRVAVEEIRRLGGVVYEREESSVPRWIRQSFPDDFFIRVAWVNLEGPEITDAELEHLKGMDSLEHLTLTYARVTDDGLELLRGMSSLRCLYLDGTQVTDAGVEKLQEALPNCRIEH